MLVNHRHLALVAMLVAGAVADGTCSATRLNGTSFHGNLKPVDTRGVDSAASCCTKCATTAQCAIWTWNTATRTCYLRPLGVSTFSNAAAVSGYTSAFVPTPAPPTPPPTPPPTVPPTPPTPPPTPPPNPCRTCRGPVWSWDTFPAFFHGSDTSGPGGGFTDEALDTIARFPMATLEKWQGSAVTPFLYEEQAWVVAARQIKARSPNTTVIVWLDSFRIYTADRALNPDLERPCTTGHFLPAQFLETHAGYLLKNASGQPALEAWSHCHIFDHTQAAARAYWRDMCLAMTGSGAIDGCGADASWQTGVAQAAQWGLDNATARAWDAGHRQMMRETTAALGDGVLLGKDPWELGDYVNGVLHEGCAPSNDTVNTLRNLSAVARQQGRRLVYQCHGKGHVDEIAAFLCGVGPYQYYGLGGWNANEKRGNFSDHWVPGVFGRELGAPVADAAYDTATATWSRHFSGGTSVSFNARTNLGNITWGRGERPD
eukprot:g218.t1